jgi:hypothetical protein
LFISLGPLASWFIPKDINKNPTYIFYTLLLYISGCSIYYFHGYLKKKKVVF